MIGHGARLQNDWDLDAYQILPLSRLTVKVRWPRVTGAFAGLIKKNIPARGWVLDIGAGDGSLYPLIKEACGFFAAVEPSRKQSRGFSPAPRRYMCNGYGEFLPYKSGLFDAVVIKAALDHCADPAGVLLESSRVLKDGGKVFILLSNEGAWYKRLLGRYNQRRRRGDSHNFYFDPSQVKRLLEGNGFRGVDTYDFDFLRLPVILENRLFDFVPEKALLYCMERTDAMFTRALPGQGGNFICVASKCVSAKEGS